MIDFKSYPDELVAIYGVLQLELKREGVLNPLAIPIKAKYPQSNLDALALYKWLAEILREVQEPEINKRKNAFNNIVKGLKKEYLLNMSLLAIFMIERLLTDFSSKPQMLVYMPKVNRLIEHLRAGILQDNPTEGTRIIRDSKIGSSNIMNIFDGGVEVTMAMRKWKLDKWRKGV